MTEIQNYNLLAKEFAEYRENSPTEWLLGYPKVAELLEPLEGKRILDFGCGAGKFGYYLAKLGAIVTGVDISSELINLARSKYGMSCKFIHSSSIWPTCFEDGIFDAAVLAFTTCVIPIREDIITILKGIHSCLSNNGMCVLINQNWEKCNGNEFASYKLEKYDSLHTGQIIELTMKYDPPLRLIDYFWSQNDYAQMLINAGFSDVQTIEIFAEVNHPSFIDEAKGSVYFLTVGRKCSKSRD
jgi:ubiquinone/menaquinone biosynthesis C-methylase UbiE